MNTEKTCTECGEKIIGRSDKKFCSDQCRITYNNRMNSDQTNHIRNINNALRKNHRILEELNSSGKTKVQGKQLIEKGFDFGLFTSMYVTGKGNQYFYCYDQGYLWVDNTFYLLVRKKMG